MLHCAGAAFITSFEFHGPPRSEKSMRWEDGCAALFNITLECISINLHFRLAKCTGGSKIFSYLNETRPETLETPPLRRFCAAGTKILILPGACKMNGSLRANHRHLIFRPAKRKCFWSCRLSWRAVEVHLEHAVQTIDSNWFLKLLSTWHKSPDKIYSVCW